MTYEMMSMVYDSMIDDSLIYLSIIFLSDIWYDRYMIYVNVLCQCLCPMVIVTVWSMSLWTNSIWYGSDTVDIAPASLQLWWNSLQAGFQEMWVEQPNAADVSTLPTLALVVALVVATIANMDYGLMFFC